jgi:hypothetical protein
MKLMFEEAGEVVDIVFVTKEDVERRLCSESFRHQNA